jgi:hypothetical protein
MNSKNKLELCLKKKLREVNIPLVLGMGNVT